MSEPIELKIDARWKWAARDECGDWYAHDDKPKPFYSGWFCGEKARAGTPISQFFGEITFPGDWKDSLHQIISGKLVKYVDVPGDGEKVIVQFGPQGRRRYSAGEINKNDCLLCYDGGDKWTSGGKLCGWEHWRRPTPEELAE